MNDTEIRERCESFRHTLDCAVYSRGPLDADSVREFNEFVAAYPHVLEWKDYSGKTLCKALFLYLRHAINHGYQWSTFKALVVRTQQVLAETDAEGWTLLHHVCACNPTALDIISSLVEKFPDAARINDQWQDTPLHVACCRKAPLPVIRVLVEANLQAVDISNEYGYTPLHYACWSGIVPRDAIQYLVAQAPYICFHRDKGGSIPLDRAKNPCGTRNPDVIEFMTTATKAAGNVLMERLRFTGSLPREIYERVATFAHRGSLAEVSMVELALSCGEIAFLFRRDHVRDEFLVRMQAE